MSELTLNANRNKKKMHQKNELRFNFTIEIYLKFMQNGKKITLKLGVKNTH